MSVTETTEDAPRTRVATRNRELTRERLLESARVLFADRGLHGVTTHDIARDAGVAAGTFYLHFENKEAVFRQIAGSCVAQLREQLGRALQNADTPEEAVRAHAEALVVFAEGNRELIRILFSGDADAASVESEVLDELAETIARARSASGRVPHDCDAEVLGHALVGMYARVVAWWAEDPSRKDREAVIQTLTRIQLAGTQP